MMLIDVALPISSNETFVYSVPRKFEDGIEVGKRVFVPFGNRKAIGYIVGKGKKSQDFEVKEIIDILDENPLFNKKKLEFFKWISDYYMSSIGIVLKFAHPSGLGKSLKKVVKLTKHGKSNINSENIYPFKKQILNALSIEESLSVERILNIIDEIKFEDLNSLFRRKFIELDYEVVENEKIKYEKLYSSISDIDKIPYLKKKKPAKGLILEFIHNHSRVSHHELKELFGNLNQHIKWLQENKLIKCELKEISRDPFKNYELKVDSENKLTPDQENVFDQIKKSIKAKKYSSFLLHGVTGSGKTEIYLRAIKEVLLMKKQALVLVPEISLTPLLVSRFRARFGDRVVVIHSQLSEGDRFDAWRRANRGDVDIIIGARSAIFAPVNKLGIIVVDEEHENTYKEGQNPFYNARDLALVLGNMNNCPVILGSATPSLESYSNTINGKYRYLTLPSRIGNTVLPEVELVDMKNVKEKIFSPQLKNSLIQNYEDNNQTLLFLNRRGFNNLMVCQHCGEMLTCPNCSITLTYHKKGNLIKCHYCGLNEAFGNKCFNCSENYYGLGLGTQKIDEEVRKMLPEAKVEIMDADTMKGKSKLLSLYKRLENKEVDILIGTQMIAKGHDLPGVTLVGIISADQSLGLPDFRSGERTFQLVTQVAGRAGRGDVPGKVVVQTYNPEHPSIKFALNHDSEGFLKQEMEIRRPLFYPPFSKLVNIKIKSSKEDEGKVFIKNLKTISRQLCSKLPENVSIELAGPSEAPIYRMQNKYRWQMLVKAENHNLLNIYCSKLYELLKNKKGSIKLSMDIDPYNFM